MNKSLTLDQVINQFFDKHKTGSRQEIINYAKDCINKFKVIDGINNKLTKAARTTIFDYLRSLGCYSISIKKIKDRGVPVTYFFRLKNEEEVKKTLLEKDYRIGLLKKIVKLELSENSLTLKEKGKRVGVGGTMYKTYLSLLEKWKPENLNLDTYLIGLKNDEHALGNLFWKHYKKNV